MPSYLSGEDMVAINSTKRLAYVLNDKVVLVHSSSERAAAILTSNPIVINITEHPYASRIEVGLPYNQETKQFGGLPNE